MKMPDFEIYTDAWQCETFGTSYYDREANLVIAADRLLDSRGPGGYDNGHTAFLRQFGTATLVLRRSRDQGPGWWRVEQVIT